MHAVRNIRLCTKDCLCLYVCPTGATDTETGQIDAEKCLSGCRACVDACPSHAISLVPEEFPEQQEKTDQVKVELLNLTESKTKQEMIALKIAKSTDDSTLRQVAEAFAKSNRLMTEDLMRESGYMLPQSQNVNRLLEELRMENKFDDFPESVVERLIELMQSN